MSRIYYAAFHAARALLLLDGVEAKTHSGLAHLFNERLVRSQRLEPLSAADVAVEIEAARELVDLAETSVSNAP